MRKATLKTDLLISDLSYNDLTSIGDYQLEGVSDEPTRVYCTISLYVIMNIDML
eukprot:m.216134 g.216134  ORF g.216134 m.216134 type:complete len:54 (+) comp39848_c0_seq40:764-925(+)